MFEAVNPDAALPGASGLRDVESERRTEHADLGESPTESERLDAWQDPDDWEHEQYGHVSHHPQIQMLCQHLQLQNRNVHHIL